MRNRVLVILLFCFFIISKSAAQPRQFAYSDNNFVKGFVVDAKTGEPLAGVTLV